jgi:hypothetical protein
MTRAATRRDSLALGFGVLPLASIHIRAFTIQHLVMLLCARDPGYFSRGSWNSVRPDAFQFLAAALAFAGLAGYGT